MLILTPLLRSLAERAAREKTVITRTNWKLPHFTRWKLWKWRDWTVFLHYFQRSDADEMHDHPWPFTSIVLAGGYYETTPAVGWKNGKGPTQRRWYGPGRVLSRPAEWIHRIEIPEGNECWTLVLHGKSCRDWGFWCPKAGFRTMDEHHVAMKATTDGCA